MVVWLYQCAEAVAWACQVQGADAGAPSRVRDEEERVYFNLDCSAASAGLLVL
jgi:hypothetical protein